MVALTAFDRDKLLEFTRLRPLFDADRLVVKPNPVRVEEGPVQPWDARRRQFLFAGRLEELKGLPTVLEAWDLLGAKTPPDLLIAGEGPLGDWARVPRRAEGDLPRPADPGGTPPPYGRKQGRAGGQPLLREFCPRPGGGPLPRHAGIGQ